MVRAAATVLAVALVAVAPAWAAKPAPPRGAYTCFVIDIIVGPDGNPSKDKVWRIELQYKGERHFCDRPRNG